jgi:hypothetical protein
LGMVPRVYRTVRLFLLACRYKSFTSLWCSHDPDSNALTERSPASPSFVSQIANPLGSRASLAVQQAMKDSACSLCALTGHTLARAVVRLARFSRHWLHSFRYMAGVWCACASLIKLYVINILVDGSLGTELRSVPAMRTTCGLHRTFPSLPNCCSTRMEQSTNSLRSSMTISRSTKRSLLFRCVISFYPYSAQFPF